MDAETMGVAIGDADPATGESDLATLCIDAGIDRLSPNVVTLAGHLPTAAHDLVSPQSSALPKPGYNVSVVGGIGYAAADEPWLRARVKALCRRRERTNYVCFDFAPTAGAGPVLLHTLGRERHSRYRLLNWRGYGRAAEFREAFDMMSHCHALIAFEPLDLLARYAIELAAQIPDRDGRRGRGVQVAIVPRRAGASLRSAVRRW
jgi:hypothetical protein